MNTIDNKIKELNNQHLYEIRRILNRYSYIFTKLREATPEEDMKQGFDAVFSFQDVKIPVRIRNSEYFERFADFTIRSRSRFGKETEIDKLRSGFGDYYFYAWRNKDNTKIARYVIVNLDVFRKSVIDRHGKEQHNNDGTQFFPYGLFDMIKCGAVILYEKIL